MSAQGILLLLGRPPGQGALPVPGDPELDRGGVVAVRVVQHQIDAQCVVEVVRICGPLADLVLQAQHDAGQQGLVKQSAVGSGGLGAELVPLVEPQAHGPGGARVALRVAARDGAGGIQQRQHAERVAVLGRQGLDLIARWSATDPATSAT